MSLVCLIDNSNDKILFTSSQLSVILCLRTNEPVLYSLTSHGGTTWLVLNELLDHRKYPNWADVFVRGDSTLITCIIL